MWNTGENKWIMWHVEQKGPTSKWTHLNLVRMNHRSYEQVSSAFTQHQLRTEKRICMCFTSGQHFLWQRPSPPVVNESATQKAGTRFKVIDQPSLHLQAIHHIFEQKNPSRKQFSRFNDSSTQQWSDDKRKSLSGRFKGHVNYGWPGNVGVKWV